MSITAAAIATQLGGAKPAGDGWMCRCPTHSDGKASLWIKDKSGGGLHVRCHADCERGAVEAALKAKKLWPEPGASKRDNKDAKSRDRTGREIDHFVLPVPANAPEPDWGRMTMGQPSQVYAYRDTTGRLRSYVARWDELGGSKEIRPLSLAMLKNGRTEWVMKRHQPPFSLYGLELLAKRPEAPVLIVEGEKAAEAGRKLFADHIVLSWQGGASAVRDTDFRPLAGRTVVLWPDADDPGRRAMAAVADAVRPHVAGDVLIVPLPDELPKGWDVADPPPEGFSITAALDAAAAANEAPNAGADSATPAEASAGARPSGLRPLVLSADELVALELPTRDLIIEPFLPVSSLTMIYGARGGGKTWVGMSMAMAIAKGEDFLGYSVSRPWDVLYVDGEMAFSDLQQRVKALTSSPPGNLMILPSERLFREARPLNLHDVEDQEAVLKLIIDLEAEGVRPSVVFFDNLSSLSGGVDENDNSALDALLRWLIGLRHLGIAIVLVHHAGKNGAQRGASRREDLLDTSISLMPPPEDSPPHEGAHLVLRFVKTRGKKPQPDELELRLSENRGQLEWQFTRLTAADRATELLRLIWEKTPDSQVALGLVAGLSKGAVSQHCTRLRKKGELREDRLELTPCGLERLIEVWPELEPRIRKQGTLLPGDQI